MVAPTLRRSISTGRADHCRAVLLGCVFFLLGGCTFLLDEPDPPIVTVDGGRDAGMPEDAGGGGDAGCIDDELLGNQVPENAVPVGLGASVRSLVICPDTTDWFRVTLLEGDRAEVQLTFANANGDLDVFIFAPGATDEPITGATSTDDNEVVGFRANTAGDYAIAVIGYRGASNAYSLDVTQQCSLDRDCRDSLAICHHDRRNIGGLGRCVPTVTPACGQDDASEPNGTDTNAESLTPVSGSAIVEDRALCQEDLDVYSFQTTETGTLTAVATWTGAADLDISIRSAALERPMGVGFSPESGREEAVAPFVEPDTYFIYVAQFSGDIDVTYDLNVNLVAATCSVDNDCLVSNPRRARCDGGACVDTVGDRSVALGGTCDDILDCVPEAQLCFIPENQPGICTIGCGQESECDVVPSTICDAPDGGPQACVPESPTDA